MPSSATLVPTSTPSNRPSPATRQLLKKEVGSLLAELSARERRILELRYGLGSHEPRTLQEIGLEVGLTGSGYARSKGKPWTSTRAQPERPSARVLDGVRQLPGLSPAYCQ